MNQEAAASDPGLAGGSGDPSRCEASPDAGARVRRRVAVGLVATAALSVQEKLTRPSGLVATATEDLTLLVDSAAAGWYPIAASLLFVKSRACGSVL